MFKNLLSLAFQGVLRKKRTSSLVFFILLISFAFSIVSLSLVGSISKTNTEIRLSNFGAWNFSLPSKTEETRQWLEKQPWIDKIGTSQIIGDLISSTYQVSFGAMDNTMLEIGRFKLDAGHWPEKDNEVAIESITLALMGYDPVLGQEIELFPRIGEGDKVPIPVTYTLCGVIHGYSDLWVSRLRDPISVVVTKSEADRILHEAAPYLSDFPDSMYSSLANQAPQYYLTIREDDLDIAEKSLKAYCDKMRIEGFPDMLLCENNLAYPAISSESYNVFYSYIIAGVALVAVLCSYIIQLPTETKSYATLRSIGITKVQLAFLLLMESVVLCLPAVLLGLPLGIALTDLSLRLLMYSGSVPIQVAVPVEVLKTVGLLWIATVLIARLIVLMVTVRTPLVGKFQLKVENARRARFFRNGLVLFLLIGFGFVTVFTVLEAADPLEARTHFQIAYSYEIVGAMGGQVWDGQIEQLSRVPGVLNVEGFSELEANLSFDSQGIDFPIHLYAVDTDNWANTLHLGKDTEKFRSGELCILCLPDDLQNYELPENTVTIHGYGKMGNEDITSRPTPYSVRRMGNEVLNKRSAYLDKPYTVVVSHQYMKDMIATMEDGMSWNGFAKDRKYGYHIVFAYADMNAGDLSTDVAFANICARLQLPFYSMREEASLQIQLATQHLILLFAGGGSIALILILILGSTLSLETEQEKKYYHTLHVIGMSKHQMMSDIFKKTFFRGGISILTGIILYYLYLLLKRQGDEGTVFDKLRSIISLQRWFKIDAIDVFALCAVCFLAISAVSIFSKWRLRKEVDRL